MRLALIVTAAAGLLANGCSRPAESARPVHHIPAAALKDLQLGKANPTDVEHAFGPPDEIGAERAMVYHAEVAVGHEPARRETITFRFEHGALSKLCRSEVDQH